jgi:hypothetical protein
MLHLVTLVSCTLLIRYIAQHGAAGVPLPCPCWCWVRPGVH